MVGKDKASPTAGDRAGSAAMAKRLAMTHRTKTSILRAMAGA
jgi:hypothetical protein